MDTKNQEQYQWQGLTPIFLANTSLTNEWREMTKNRPKGHLAFLNVRHRLSKIWFSSEFFSIEWTLDIVGFLDWVISKRVVWQYGMTKSNEGQLKWPLDIDISPICHKPTIQQHPIFILEPNPLLKFIWGRIEDSLARSTRAASCASWAHFASTCRCRP